ncbi:hypothetical protein HGH93_26195 [Chitinophaga polysaccharea]|uniref:hypothetical protein n=1 Tax=Chitinophaga TaxID=79328 RepID=UPI0014557505|nr:MULTISPECIES: hypothetical protein [Chitinophaga]NLR61621.1 hypothetical protein [Chitinophaga polysaccharea]NLU93784.1 hypothetical protein [Chitinophaga sp. Ak27]
MKSPYLLPHLYKKIGGILFLLTFGTWLLGMVMDFSYSWVDYNTTKGSQGNFSDEIIVTGLIISLLMIAFSKEKNEDEYIAAVRRESLQWSIYINYGLLLIGTWTFYNWDYFAVLVYNMFTPLIFFILRFHFVIIKNRRTLPS